MRFLKGKISERIQLRPQIVLHIKNGIFKTIGVEKPQVKRSSHGVLFKRSDPSTWG